MVENSKKLLERYNNSHIKIQGDCKETHSSLREEIEVFQALFKSTQSWISDLRQAVDSPLAESPWIQTPLEQKLHCAQVRKCCLHILRYSVSLCHLDHRFYLAHFIRKYALYHTYMHVLSTCVERWQKGLIACGILNNKSSYSHISDCDVGVPTVVCNVTWGRDVGAFFFSTFVPTCSKLRSVHLLCRADVRFRELSGIYMCVSKLTVSLIQAESWRFFITAFLFY